MVSPVMHEEAEKLVVIVAGNLCRSFRRGIADRSDLEQEGRMQVILSMRKYKKDLSKESTYLYKSVKGRMLDVLTESMGPARIPSDALYKTEAPPKSTRRAHALRFRDMKCVSPSVLDKMANLGGDPVVEHAEHEESVALTRESVEMLTQIEKAVIEGLFGLDGNPCTPTALARRLGVTYERLIKIRTRGLRKLKMWLKDKGINDDSGY
jgi:RNA polymerase sigma factor (sigma-70 family)